jgi:hypothetical protein
MAKYCIKLSLSHACCTSCPSQYSFFNHHNNIRPDELRMAFNQQTIIQHLWTLAIYDDDGGGGDDDIDLMKRYIRFQVHMVARMKMAVFWVVVPCSLVEVYQCFRVFAVFNIRPHNPHRLPTWSSQSSTLSEWFPYL